MFNKLNILKPFFEDPLKQYGVRETAKIINLAPATTSKFLKSLKKEKILKEERFRNYLLYKANITNNAYLDLKIYYNVRKIRNSGLIDALNKFYDDPAIQLFGSHSNGYDYKDSDIDLVIVSENNKEFPKQKEFEEKLSRELHIFAVKKLKDLGNEDLAINILKGISLQGDIQWNWKSATKKVLFEK